MSEINIGWLATLSGIGLITASTLYWWGGTTNKLWRRLGGALVLSITTIGISAILGKFSPILLLIPLALFVGYSMGYGVNDNNFVKKIVRRFVYMIGVCGAGLIYCLTFGGNSWLIFPLHIGVGIWSIWLGVKNPIHAKAEEFFICLLLNTGLVMYPFMR